MKKKVEQFREWLKSELVAYEAGKYVIAEDNVGQVVIEDVIKKFNEVFVNEKETTYTQR